MEQDELRGSLTGGLWIMIGIVLAALFISAAAQNEITGIHMILTFTLLAVAGAGTYFIWYILPDSQRQHVEKAKRQRLDDALKELSDDELIALKQRLSDGEYSEESILEYLDREGRTAQSR